jgi:hypothetical protein
VRAFTSHLQGGLAFYFSAVLPRGLLCRKRTVNGQPGAKGKVQVSSVVDDTPSAESPLLPLDGEYGKRRAVELMRDRGL